MKYNIAIALVITLGILFLVGQFIVMTAIYGLAITIASLIAAVLVIGVLIGVSIALTYVTK